jgi:hypothetical protein
VEVGRAKFPFSNSASRENPVPPCCAIISSQNVLEGFLASIIAAHVEEEKSTR